MTDKAVDQGRVPELLEGHSFPACGCYIHLDIDLAERYQVKLHPCPKLI